MKKIIVALLFIIPTFAFGQVTVVNDANSPVFWRDAGLISGGGSGSLAKAFIDMSKPPYSLTAGANGSAAVQLAVDSLWSTYRGGTVYIPMNLNWPRPNAGSQKGVLLRPNIRIVGIGNTLTMTDNCAFFSTDFGLDSLGAEINAPLDSSMTNIQVVSSAGFAVGDTVYGRFGTAAYDAFEPAVFGWFIVTAVPNSTHITLNRPCGANMAYAGSSLNRRLIRVHNLVTNASIEGFNLVSPQSGGAIAEAGIYLQGGWNIKLKDIKATNPGAGLLVAQFCENTLLQNFHMKQNVNAGNASFGRGISIQESPGTVIRDGTLEGYESAAFICEADNPGLLIENVRINNTYSNALRKAFVSLGSTDFIANQISFGGYQHQVYDASQSPGRFKLNNPIFDKGTPFFMYNEQGVDVVVSQGSFTVGDQVFGARKTYTQKLAIPVNGSTAIELPKGWLERFDILVTSTTGITEAYLRRDNSFTNNTSSFHGQLVANSSIRASLGQAFQFATGALIPGNGLNYNYDKGFVISTNSSMAAGQYATVVATYYEPVNAALNAQNATPYDAPLSGGSGRRNSTADYVATDANQTAVAGSTLRLPAGTLTANRTIDISALSTEGDYLEIINKEAVFKWSFTGGSVYLSDEVTTVTTLPAVGNFILRVSGGKLQILN